ncbi:MAG: WD40 repeat domain-containing protein [Chloroflexi bacterium]|nr:WD40 repeat domain-containing protein [Chloroflexota bacterium]
MNKIYRFFLLNFFLGFSFLLASCGSVTPFPTGTPTITPTIIRTPTRTPLPTITKIPNATPFAQLKKLATLGEGVLPQIVYSHDGKKALISDGVILRVINLDNYKEISAFQISDYPNTRILATSPDDSLVIVDYFGHFRVIELNTHKEVAFGKGFSGWAMGSLFTPDGKHIVYRVNTALHGPYDSICLLNLNGQGNDGDDEFFCKNRYPTSVNGVMTNPAISPDGNLVAAGCSGDAQNILYIWNLKNISILHTIQGQTSRINSVAFSPDSSTLATGGDDGLIRLWDPTTGHIKRTITGFVNDVSVNDFSPDGRQLIIKVGDGPTVSYDLATGKQEAVSPGPLGPLSTKLLKEGYMMAGSGSVIRFSPNGKSLAVGHGSIQIWDVESQIIKMTLFADQSLNIAGMNYSLDGNHLAVVTVGGNIYAWNLRTGQQEFFVSADTFTDIQVFFAAGTSGPGIGAGAYSEKSATFSPDADQIAIANGAAIEIWDLQTVSRVRTLELTQPVAFPTKISYSADGKFIYASLNRNRDLAVWNVNTGKLIRQLNLPHVDPNAFTATDLNGPLFGRNNYDDNDYWIEIWNLETGQMMKLPTHSREVEPLRFSADGKFFSALFNHEQLFVWRSDTGQLVFVSDSKFDVGDFSISPDGKLLATADYGIVTLWDMGKYASTAVQPGFVPLPMPFTPTPWGGSEPALTTRPTNTPEPTQAVTSISVPSSQDGAINVDNASSLHLTGQFGKGTVSRLSWSNVDGKIWVSSSQGLYQLETGHLKELKHFGRNSLWVFSQQILPDGRSLAAVLTVDGKVQVWDMTNERMLVELNGVENPAISPDGQWLVYGNSGNGLETWNLNTMQPGVLLQSSNYLNWPVFSPDSQLVAVIQSDYSIRVWDIKTAVIVNAAGGTGATINDLSFSPDGRYLLGAAGGSAWRWSMSPGAHPLEINLFEKDEKNWADNIVTAIASKADNSTVAIGTSDKIIWLYNTQTGQLIGSLTGHHAPLFRMTFSPSGSQLVSVDEDGQMILWDVEQQRQTASIHEFSAPISGITSRLDGSISAWAQNSVWTFQPQNAELQRVTYIPGARILAASPAGDFVAGYTPLQVSLYDANTGKLIKTLPEEAEDVSQLWNGDSTRQFYGASFSPDGKRLATLGTGGIWMYTLPDGALISHLEGSNTYKADFSPDGEWLVASKNESYSEPSLITFSNANPILSTYNAVGEEYSQYAFSPDKHWIGLLRNPWDGPRSLEIISASTGKMTGRLELENVDLISLAFNPSATLIAIGCSDGKIVIVDFANLKIVTTLDGHLGAVTAVTFSKDGQSILSAGRDGTVKIWGVP